MRTLPSISKLLLGFRGNQQHIYVPDLRDFPALSAEKLIQELDLLNEGRRRGEKDEPSSQEYGFDIVENSIIERLEAVKKEAYLTGNDRLTTYLGRLRALDFSGRLSAISTTVATLPSEFDMEARNGRNTLNRHREALINKNRDYYNFRKKHKIDREPIHETGGFKALRYAVLFFLLLVETLLNGHFLSVMNVSGLVGGAAQAFIFATLNILVSFSIAVFGIRRINSGPLAWRVVGLLSIVVYIALALAINLALAHYRENLPLHPDDVGKIVVQKMLHAPLSLLDLQSWMFAATGIVFSLIAVLDGLYLYDPIPGYGNLFERKNKASIDYEDEVRALSEDLRELRDSTFEALESASRDLEKRRGEYVSILSGKKNLEMEYQKFQESLDRVTDLVFASYRNENRRARKTPVPGYFSQPVRLNRLALNTREFVIDTSLDKKIENARKETDKLVETLKQAYDNAYRSYREIDNILGEAG